MPQVWNPKCSNESDAGGFNKNSRHGKLSTFSNASLRGIKVRNMLEHNLNAMQEAIVDRKMDLINARMERHRKNINERRTRFSAVQQVLKQHPIRNRKNYEDALNDNYTARALKKEVRRMLVEIHPDTQRKRKAAALAEDSRAKYHETLSRNESAIVDLCTPRLTTAQMNAESEDEEEDLRSPTPPPAPMPARRSLFGPPLRGLAQKPQAVTLKMVKEQSWLGQGPPASPTRSVVSGAGSLNPHSILPPIQS